MSPVEFVASLGFKTPAPWSIHLSWSTVEPSHWVVRRKVLKPADVLLTLTVTDGHWVLNLKPRHQRFHVQWRSSGVSVESDELRYRRMTRWPKVSSPLEVPEAIQVLEQVLQVQFVKHVNLEGSLADEALSAGFSDERILCWLAPCACEWSVFGKRNDDARRETPA